MPTELAKSQYCVSPPTPQSYVKATQLATSLANLRLTCHRIQSEVDEEVVKDVCSYLTDLQEHLKAPHWHSVDDETFSHLLPTVYPVATTSFPKTSVNAAFKLPTTYAQSRRLHVTMTDSIMREGTFVHVVAHLLPHFRTLIFEDTKWHEAFSKLSRHGPWTRVPSDHEVLEYCERLVYWSAQNRRGVFKIELWGRGDEMLRSWDEDLIVTKTRVDEREVWWSFTAAPLKEGEMDKPDQEENRFDRLGPLGWFVGAFAALGILQLVHWVKHVWESWKVEDGLTALAECHEVLYTS